MAFREMLPWNRLMEAIEFRRLRRRLPGVHRAWSNASGRWRPESDAEYLRRLRELAHERAALRRRTRHSGAPDHAMR
jgi:hypothetical protein